MKAYNKLTEQDKQRIIDEYWKGTKFSQINEILGVSRRSVSRVLKENGVQTRRKNRYTLNEDYFEEIDSEEKAYILGFMLADGYVDIATNYVVIQLTEGDLQLLEDIAKAINFTGEIKYVPPQKNRFSKLGCYRLAFSSKKMVEDLYRHGLYKGKSLTIDKLPDVEMKLKRHLIRGLFDGDGSITTFENSKQKYEPSPTFTILCTKPIADEVANYFKEYANTTSGYIQQSKTKELVYFSIRGNKNLLNIYHELYDGSSICLERKKKKFNMIRPLREETPVCKSV